MIRLLEEERSKDMVRLVFLFREKCSSRGMGSEEEGCWGEKGGVSDPESNAKERSEQARDASITCTIWKNEIAQMS